MLYSESLLIRRGRSLGDISSTRMIAYDATREQIRAAIKGLVVDNHSQ